MYIYIHLYNPSLKHTHAHIHKYTHTHTGSLPGGVDAEAVKALTSDAEMMEIMSNPKLQELMKLVMEGKQAEVETYMADAEILQLMVRVKNICPNSHTPPRSCSFLILFLLHHIHMCKHTGPLPRACQ